MAMDGLRTQNDTESESSVVRNVQLRHLAASNSTSQMIQLISNMPCDKPEHLISEPEMHWEMVRL